MAEKNVPTNADLQAISRLINKLGESTTHGEHVQRLADLTEQFRQISDVPPGSEAVRVLEKQYQWYKDVIKTLQDLGPEKLRVEKQEFEERISYFVEQSAKIARQLQVAREQAA